jgi:UDP-N-acetyl-alpha-D-muramoyl-L-alanyl-L-glutamate epimerase
MERGDLEAVFAGDEPLQNPVNEDRFRTLLGLGTGFKPFECVGDIDECRAALALVARRADRAADELVRRLQSELGDAAPVDPLALLQPRGTHRIPDRYAPPDLLVRAR